MSLKNSLLNAGALLGAGIVLICAFARQPDIVVFALPREAQALADYQASEALKNAASLAGLVIFAICAVTRVVSACRKPKRTACASNRGSQ